MSHESEFDIEVMQHFDLIENVFVAVEMAIQHYDYKIHERAFPLAIDDRFHLENIFHEVPNHQRTTFFFRFRLKW